MIDLKGKAIWLGWTSYHLQSTICKFHAIKVGSGNRHTIGSGVEAFDDNEMVTTTMNNLMKLYTAFRHTVC